MIKREFLEMCMESPLYFTMSLRQRLELMKRIEERLAYNNLREHFLHWVKTGKINN
jgi:hypothetical protein